MTRHKRTEQIASFTLTEVLIASAIGAIVSAALMILLSIMAREYRLGIVRQRVFENADRVQDHITDLLQSASRGAGILLSDPIPPSYAFYHRIIFRTGVGAPNQQLQYNPVTKKLTYDPDISVNGDEITIGFKNDPIAKINDVQFRAAMQTGGLPDSAIILVNVTVSDNGYAMTPYRSNLSDPVNWITNTRSFAVNLRRN